MIPDLPDVQDVECLLLFQALCGVMVDIPTLTGDKIPLNLANEVIKPTTVKRIPGETKNAWSFQNKNDNCDL